MKFCSIPIPINSNNLNPWFRCGSIKCFHTGFRRLMKITFVSLFRKVSKFIWSSQHRLSSIRVRAETTEITSIIMKPEISFELTDFCCFFLFNKNFFALTFLQMSQLFLLVNFFTRNILIDTIRAHCFLPLNSFVSLLYHSLAITSAYVNKIKFPMKLINKMRF